MSGKLVARVSLRRDTHDDGTTRELDAYIDGEGRLVLEGYDIGPSVEQAWGDSDYEYWRRVEPKYLTSILLLLIQERFESDVQFHEWLHAHGIPDTFESWT